MDAILPVLPLSIVVTVSSLMMGIALGRWLEKRRLHQSKAVQGKAVQGSNRLGAIAHSTGNKKEDSEEQLRQIIDSIKDVFYLKSLPSGELLYVNPMYEEIFHRPRETLEENPSSWMNNIHPEDRDRMTNVVQQQLETHQFSEQEYRLCLPDGTIRWIWDQAFPIVDKDGRVYRLAGVNRDITVQKETELSLKASLQEKDVLLSEIHHRVKNNLQLISSLLSLQANRVDDDASKEALRETYHRVQAIAQIHQALYSSHNLEKIKFLSYAKRITRNLISSFTRHHQHVELQLNIDPEIFITLSKAVPCALILNELVVNALKHGIRDKSLGHIEIDLNYNDDQHYYLSVANDGYQLPDTFSLDKPTSMGLRLIVSLVDQLHGQISVCQSSMTRFVVVFPV
jgi:PAS domain S-box-containing protein